jgi:hypothetical protein
MAKQARSKKTNAGGEPGNDQQASRRDREDTGSGRGTKRSGVNQGRHGNRKSGRNGRSEKGDAGRSQKK